MYVFRKLTLWYAVVNRYLAMAVNFVYLKYLNSVHINYYTGILLKTLKFSYEPSFLRTCTKLYNSILHCTWRTPLSWIAGTFAFREETTDGCLGPFWALLKKYLKKDIYRTACIMSNAFKTAALNLLPLNRLTAYIYTYRLSAQSYVII